MSRALLPGIALLGYLAVVRPRLLRWGASDDEMSRPMLGDNQIEHPTIITNRAITIEAPPEDIWPWLAQMGEAPRAGFYSYAWVEALLGMEIENARDLLPEFQHPQVGTLLDRKGNMLVRAIDPGRALVLGPPPGFWMDSTWAVGVYQASDKTTRLVSRVRLQVFRWTPMALFMLAMLDPGQFIMERKFLLEVKGRAERLAGREALAIAVAQAQTSA